MGGYGSGRTQERDCTDDYVRLDVRWLKRQNYLRPGWCGTVNWSRRGERFAWINVEGGEGEITLRYRTRPRGEEWQERHYPVAVEGAPCHFGSNRAWFRCPRCSRPAAILYGATIFACRLCLRLVYESQREAPHYRALRKEQAIHQKLGGTGITDDPVFKPKGMHWRTYSRHMDAGLIVVSGPGVTAGGATEWSLAVAKGANSCTYPVSGTWYVGAPTAANNPLAARLKKAGITSTAYSYGILGGSNAGCPDNHFDPGTLIGASQTGNALTLVSFSYGGTTTDYDVPQESLIFTYSHA